MQTETVPSSTPIDWADPINWDKFAKMSLATLEMLMSAAEAELEAKILERNKKSDELKRLDDEFHAASLDAESFPGVKDDLMKRCQAAGREQHAHNLEIERRHRALLPMLCEIIAKKNPL
jgi:hypothetical protein